MFFKLRYMQCTCNRCLAPSSPVVTENQVIPQDVPYMLRKQCSTAAVFVQYSPADIYLQVRIDITPHLLYEVLLL